jgi:MFS family permease
VALAAGILEWLATSPAWLVHINWDAGSYLHQIVAGTVGWASPTWTAHAGLQYVYLAACVPAKAMHGTCLDGFRGLNALCFAISAAALAAAGLRLAQERLLSALLVAVWATAFVTQFLVFTLEDNIVFLTPAILLLWLCATRAEKWGARESLTAGLLAAAAALLSIQGTLYCLAPAYVAAFLPRADAGWLRRLRDLGLVLLGLLLGLASFAAFFAAIATLPWRASLNFLAARPKPSQFPENFAGLVALLSNIPGLLRMIGIAVSFHVFRNRLPWSGPSALVGLGAIALLGLVAIAIAATFWSRKTKKWTAHFFAILLLAMILLTSLYRDVEYAYLKRTDFVPILLVLLAMAAVGARTLTARTRHALAIFLGLVVAWQTVSGLLWRSHEVATYETLDTTALQHRVPGYHGIPGEGSFWNHFRSLRERNPKACAFVFDLSDVIHGRWNPDLTGVIRSELPEHFVLAEPSTMRSWPRPLHALAISQARDVLRGCEWISPEAERRLHNAFPGWSAARQTP